MKLKLKSDGTIASTRLIDALTGEPIGPVQEFHLAAEQGEHFVECVIRLVGMELELTVAVPFEDIYVCKGCYKPLLRKNAWMMDGCPCNTASGINDGNRCPFCRETRAVASCGCSRKNEEESRAKPRSTTPPALVPPENLDLDARCVVGEALAPGVPNAELKSDGQQKGYVVLCEEERAKGFVRPVRRSYKHTRCETVTTISQAIAETYARAPTQFYSGTFCAACKGYFPVGADGEFYWCDPNSGKVIPEKVGT
jgi:hypothetical protein